MTVEIVFKYAQKEKRRLQTTLSLIASENSIYPEALKIAKYPLVNKYSEGYPGKRFYAGCENIDLVEEKAIAEAKKAFSCNFANVQAYSGSIANFAIYKALLNVGDAILSMEMSSGGHLTHSSKYSFVSHLYKPYTYSVDPVTFRIDYEEVKNIALKVKPKLIVAGTSSYPFQIDFKKFREIADLVGAYLFADVCHLSAFIISKQHPHCFPYAHVAMCTTHKQLRGSRGAIILWNDENLSNSINKSVFPGIQGGMNPASVAMNAIALTKANTAEFIDYSKQVLLNAKAMCSKLIELGVDIVGKGTETHMFLINTKKSFNLTGKQASLILERAGLITNPNLIPYDTESPFVTSGIRIGTLYLSTLGLKVDNCIWIAEQIYKILKNSDRKMLYSETKNYLKKLLREHR